MASSLLLGTSQSLSLSFSRSISAVPLSSLSSAAPASGATASPAPPLIYCGRGDKKTARGKRFNHSFGNARPRDKKKGRGPPKAPILPSAPKKDPFDDDQVIKIDIDE